MSVYRYDMPWNICGPLPSMGGRVTCGQGFGAEISISNLHYGGMEEELEQKETNYNTRLRQRRGLSDSPYLAYSLPLPNGYLSET